MPRLTTNINGINGVGAGQTATVLFPTDRRYHEILLKVADDTHPNPSWTDMANIIDLIRIKANAVTIREFTVNELLVVLNSKGMLDNIEAGYLPIFFSEPWRVTRFEEEIFAFVTKGLSTFSLEVTFKSGAFVPQLSGLITYDYSNDNNRAFMKWERHTVPMSSAGDFDWNTVSRIGAISTIHLLTDQIERVKVTTDNQEVIDRTRAQNERLLSHHGFYQGSESTPVMFDYTGYSDDALTLTKPTATPGVVVPRDEFNVKITKSTPGSIPALIERIQYV